jgi:DNA polymerase I-like protein with 3'-5' exonuclease and polymerase domains
VTIHNIWKRPVGETLQLIRKIMTYEGGLIGYNNVHEAYHYNMTYGVLSMLPEGDPPDVMDYYDCVQSNESRDNFCVKPVKSLDLMIAGRKGEFQSTLKQKDIVVRKIPSILAEELIKELTQRVKIPEIYFAKGEKGYRWDIKELSAEGLKEITPEDRKAGTAIHPDLVNLRLSFNPTTALKAVIKMILGKDVDTFEDTGDVEKHEEYGWWPWYADGWLRTIKSHMLKWSSAKALEYAKNDVVYLGALDQYLKYPEMGDNDSELCFCVGAVYWRGYTIDRPKCEAQLKTREEQLADFAKESGNVNIDSPVQVKTWIHSFCTDKLEKMMIPDTSKKTLEFIIKSPEWKESNPVLVEKVSKLMEARKSGDLIQLFQRVLQVGRLHVSFKVSGTKSDRMAGGNESFVSRGGSINPQGIKHDPAVRECFTLGFDDLPLTGGDFDSFEISIAEALYSDPGLRKELMTGKKFHALMGSVFYGRSYEEILATSELSKDHPDGLYSRAKTADFAWFYGAEPAKLAETLWLSVEEVVEAMVELARRYPKIKEVQDKEKLRFAAMHQPDGLGTKIVWKEPETYSETFLGFKRFFHMEFSVVRALFDLAQKPTDELKRLGSKVKVQRNDRVQSGSGALSSALYGAAFGIQNSVQRIAINLGIQSPGAQITKHVERVIWDIQPSGVNPWIVMPMNAHDEIMSPTKRGYEKLVKTVVDETVESYRSKIPLISMKYKTNMQNWGEK